MYSDVLLYGPGGLFLGGLGGLWPPNFWPATLFSGFSHTTDRNVPSEVVPIKLKSVDMTFFFYLIGDYCNPQHRVTSIVTAFVPPPTFKWKLPPVDPY